MSTVLLFKNIFYSSRKEENNWFSQSTLYLASALKKSGIKVVFSYFKFAPKGDLKNDLRGLESILEENPKIGFIGISLCEDFFEDAHRLIGFLRKRTNAFIGVGGVMPTLTPKQVFAHLPEINFLVRGAGEEVLPRLVKILEGKDINSSFNEQERDKLSKLQGMVFHNKHALIYSSLDKINQPDNYDFSALDFTLLEKENLLEGVNLFTSRGCFNNCYFCTTPGKSKYTAKSLQNLKTILDSYHKRLKDIFGADIPRYAFKISFNDDDFLGDDKRARQFFAYLKDKPFRINFFQTGINSFFKRINNGYTDTLNTALISSLSSSIFSADKRNIYIGTENFCDDELARLGKGYNYSKIEKVAQSLAKKKIYQVHHFIVSNQLTVPRNLLDNLIKIVVLRARFGEYFQVLTPVIPYLVSLYPSVSYRMAVSQKREKFLNIRRTLSIKGHPEYDYPLVASDIPVDRITRQMVPVIHTLFSSEKEYAKILDMALFSLLLMRESNSGQRKEISRLIGAYRDYPSIIFKKTGAKLKNDRYNLQLMITRRCQLRCRYCPVEKKNQDMSEKVLFGAVALLFSSSRDAVRLDFTGGEPLLRFDLIKKAVRYAKELSRRKNKAVSFYLVTNLIALTDEMADFLKSEDFFLELSVDGEEKFHNLYKCGLDRRINPYRLTASKLSSIFTRRVNNYAVLVGSPLTVKYLGRNFYHLLCLGFRKIGINYALGAFWQEKERKEFFRQLDLIRGRFHAQIENGLISLSNLESRVEPAILNSEIMVDTDGEIHLLTDWLFETKMKRKAPALGRTGDIDDLNAIWLGRFRVLERLLEYCPSSRARKTIFNNIEMGNAAQAYFKEWKKK